MDLPVAMEPVRPMRSIPWVGGVGCWGVQNWSGGDGGVVEVGNDVVLGLDRALVFVFRSP